MKSEFLDVQYFKIIPRESVPENATRENIIEIAEPIPEFSHISGSAVFFTEEQQSAAGRYFTHQFSFSISSYIEEDLLQQIRNAGAVVIYTDIRTLVLYANDVFSNVPLRFSVKSNHDVTDVNLTRNTIPAL